MSMKKLFAEQLRLQREAIAKDTLQQVLRSGASGRTKVSDFLDELKSDEVMWSAFLALRIDDLRAMFAPGPAPGGPPGPTRKRGVTSGRIIEFVAANPGARRGDIMSALGLKGGTTSSQLRMLRTQGRLRGEGEERNLQYYIP